MDSQGRLHMPGFVGETFEETGVLKKRPNEPVAENRHERRRREAIERREGQLSKALAKARGETV